LVKKKNKQNKNKNNFNVSLALGAKSGLYAGCSKNFPAELLKHCLRSGSSVRARIVVQEHHAA
jgi:hypothetical protein